MERQVALLLAGLLQGQLVRLRLRVILAVSLQLGRSGLSIIQYAAKTKRERDST